MEKPIQIGFINGVKSILTVLQFGATGRGKYKRKMGREIP